MTLSDACEIASSTPPKTWPREVLAAGIFNAMESPACLLPSVIDALVILEVAPSKSRARTMLSQSGVRLNGEVVRADRRLTKDDLLYGEWAIVSLGKYGHNAVHVNREVA